jgi:hypothetical protein
MVSLDFGKCDRDFHVVESLDGKRQQHFSSFDVDALFSERDLFALLMEEGYGKVQIEYEV